MRRRRLAGFAALALAVPVPALALTGGGDGGPGAPPVALNVSASLGECGLAGTAIVCRIDASWGSVEGVEYFTATVTRADGSVVDYGNVGAGGGTSLWIPYVGAGTYTVQISAFGTPPGEDEPELVAEDTATTGKGDGGSVKHEGRGSASAERADGEQGFGERPGGAGEATVEEPAAEEPSAEPAPCEPAPKAGPDSPARQPSAGSGDGDAGEPGALGAAESSALEAEGELPESVDCPAPAE